MLIVTYAECHIKAPYAEWRYAECRYAECHIKLHMLSGVMLNVVMLSVVAPYLLHLPIYTAMKLEIYRASVILPSVKINFRSNVSKVKLSKTW
jgi:hypothetical protein